MRALQNVTYKERLRALDLFRVSKRRPCNKHFIAVYCFPAAGWREEKSQAAQTCVVKG